jgi:hypothetical protein
MGGPAMQLEHPIATNFNITPGIEPPCVKFYLLITDDSNRYGTYTHSRR